MTRQSLLNSAAAAAAAAAAHQPPGAEYFGRRDAYRRPKDGNIYCKKTK